MQLCSNRTTKLFRRVLGCANQFKVWTRILLTGSTAYKFNRFCFIYKGLLRLFVTTSSQTFDSHHAAILVSEPSFTNYCPVQLLADKRCRWLLSQCHLLGLMQKKRKKKKLKNHTHIHEKSKPTFSTNFSHYCLKTTQPVIVSINNITSFVDRCNDCKVIKVFKKRRKYSQLQNVFIKR